MLKQNILKKFQTTCKQRGLKVTNPRMHVFQIISQSSHPLTAYEILETLSKTIDKPKPPTVYRALNFLAQYGFIHRIESLKAYIICNEDHHHSGSQFLICDSCNRAEEIHLCQVPESLDKKTKERGFKLSHWNVELHGLCENCS